MSANGVNINSLEICATSVESALIAQEGGAQRIELCDNLWEGGTTPSAGMIRQILDVDLFMLIRPRGSDFLYSEREFNVMKTDIELAQDQGVDGIVSGVLLPYETVDKTRTLKLVELSGSLPFTYHRAFDCVPDAIMAIETLIECGVTQVLTSGLQQTARQWASLLRELQLTYGDRINIMPCGGVVSTQKTYFS